MQTSELPRIAVRPGTELLLTYFDPTKGAFESVTKIDDVPQGARSWVRAIDLKIKPERRRDHELVYVADLRQAQKDGSYPYVVMSRTAFEERARNLAPRGDPDSPAAVAVGGRQHDRIILYATSWCPACRAARAWLREKGLAFAEKDIEKDPAAAAELMHKAREAGISTSGVPVIDVRGTLIQGFDPKRIAALLGG